LRREEAEVENRLAKLYEALETGQFKGGELAPRIKGLFEKKEEVRRARAEAEQALRSGTIDIVGPTAVREYVDSLRELLEESSIISKKTFLRSFVNRVEVDDKNVRVTYTMPMLPERESAETVGVLPFVQNGSPEEEAKKSRMSESLFGTFLFARLRDSRVHLPPAGLQSV
jgi:hypothetical protein